MTILDIVLTIELVLLLTIAVMLMTALLQRDKQERRSYEYGHSYAGATYLQRTRIQDFPACAYRHPYENAGWGTFAGTASGSGASAAAAYPGTAPWQQVRRTAVSPESKGGAYARSGKTGPSRKAFSRDRRWRIDFMEMPSGRRVSRDFRDHLVVGRMVNSTMDSGKLYLSMDATVSRSQFCLYVTEDGIMLENLSNVNVTRKNGYPVRVPVRLEEGDVLQLGRMRYMVKGIRPAA